MKDYLFKIEIHLLVKLQGRLESIFPPFMSHLLEEKVEIQFPPSRHEDLCTYSLIQNFFPRLVISNMIKFLPRLFAYMVGLIVSHIRSL